MEMTGSIQKVKKRQYFLTQIANEDVRVHFQDDQHFTPNPLVDLYSSAPIPNFITKSEIKSSQGKQNKKLGLRKLKSLLKSSKGSQVKSSTKREIGSSRQQNKYHRISINEENIQPSISNSQRLNISKGVQPNSSINLFLQRTQTQNIKGQQVSVNVSVKGKQMKRLQKRRQCRITTQEQFEEQCTKYVQNKQKEEANELFRQINRQMKLSEKRKDPNHYYQAIRKSALKKMDYMSENQKYYDQQEVTHLFTVVQNCNLLIHKRTRRNCKPTRDNNMQTNIQFFKARQSTKKFEQEATESLNRTSISRERLLQTQIEIGEHPNKHNHAKTVKLTTKQKASMNKKASQIVNVCMQERKMLQEVKNGMKVFQYYCNKIDSGFAVKGRRLNNFLTGDDDN